MILVMKHGATDMQVAGVIEHIESLGFKAHLSKGEERTIIGVIGDERPVQQHPWETLDGVENALEVLHKFKVASRDFHPNDSVISINGVKIGGKKLTIIGGPCAVENEEQIFAAARAVKAAGAQMLRGGAFKPRTSPYSFQGLGEEGLRLLRAAGDETGLPIVTEVMSPTQIDLVAQHSDMLQIGTRNMQNFNLLLEVGKSHKPVLLKRGMMSTIEEWMMAAEYVLSQGNDRVVLCERGIRTFEKATRNSLDINSVPLVKQLSHLPIIVDPSHGTGKWDLVAPVTRAAIAAGADGAMIEVHPNPTMALSDGAQSLKPNKFAELMEQLRALAVVMGREL